MLNLIASTGLNIEYSYAFLTPMDNKACVVLRVSDNDIAADILARNGIKTLNARQGDESPL